MELCCSNARGVFLSQGECQRCRESFCEDCAHVENYCGECIEEMVDEEPDNVTFARIFDELIRIRQQKRKRICEDYYHL